MDNNFFLHMIKTLVNLEVPKISKLITKSSCWQILIMFSSHQKSPFNWSHKFKHLFE